MMDIPVLPVFSREIFQRVLDLRYQPPDIMKSVLLITILLPSVSGGRYSTTQFPELPLDDAA